jgi:uroporphyrin-III C-methyltransferase
MSSPYTFAPGSVVLVGGGPGDPGLMTVKGLAAVRAADVVVYDRLAPLTCLDEARPEAQLIDVGKIPHLCRSSQEYINEVLISHASEGRLVVRLKGGDPFVFGRGGEEWIACAAAGVPVEVVPGVTSAVAAAGLAGIPVTHRGLTQGMTVISGHVPPGDPRSTIDWAAVARSRTTLVILMGVTHLTQICDTLLGAGLGGETPAAIIMRGGTPTQRVYRTKLADLAETAVREAVEPPAVIVIGDVVALDLGETDPRVTGSGTT